VQPPRSLSLGDEFSYSKTHHGGREGTEDALRTTRNAFFRQTPPGLGLVMVSDPGAARSAPLRACPAIIFRAFGAHLRELAARRFLFTDRFFIS
jgi:hypothetical protein